jgi:hypothetical protein
LPLDSTLALVWSISVIDRGGDTGPELAHGFAPPDMGQLGHSCSAQCRVHASEQNGNKMNKKRQFMTSRLLLASAPPVRG